ncbi:MAG: hypothetical protein R3D62_17085 [Xanthobacteraceae bacterium]
MPQASSTAPSRFGLDPPLTPVSRPGTTYDRLEWACAAVLAVGVLMIPALWNGFPLLQYDTGGYVARWYEGYLVPSRSTTFGLYLTATQTLDFWPAVLTQAILTVWVLALTLRALGFSGNPWRLPALVTALAIATTLPWLTSTLLTDVFAGLAVLALYLLVCRADALNRWEAVGLLLLIAFSVASHSATFAVLLALVAAGFLFCGSLRQILSLRGLVGGLAAIALGAGLLLATNFALSRQLAWTPGGYSIPFGRILQDGIVARYLNDHCPQPQLRLCPYRHKLPATADEFFWSSDIFTDLGRFTGLGDEMRLIFLRSLAAYPWAHVKTAVRATLAQIAMVGSGEGVHNKIWHTYGIIAHYLPATVPAMKAARQQRGKVGERTFERINKLHKPIALLSLAATILLLGRALWRRDHDALTLLAATVLLAVLANAFICGVISGPHDRYGARLAWLPALVAMAAILRAWQDRTESASEQAGTG